MKFNFNITRIRFLVGSGQRGESWVVGICIPWGNGALNGALQPVPAKRSILGSALLHMFLSDGQGVLQFGLFDSESFTSRAVFRVNILCYGWRGLSPHPTIQIEHQNHDQSKLQQRAE